jgi:hypothetical protein
MTQAEIDRQVAAATGEDASTIAEMGFVPLAPIPFERERRPLTVDWDEVDQRRLGLFPRRGACRDAVG